MNDVTTKWVYNFGAGAIRGPGRDAEPSRRQRRQPRRNGEHWPAGASGLHHHDRGLHGLLCQRRQYPADLEAQVAEALARVEAAVGLKFGDPAKPLLVSVRSGARVSMPGMMDTVLNLGLNDETVRGLVAASGDERFAWDSYRRFIQMFGSVVLGVDHHRFEEIIEQAKIDAGAIEDTALSPHHWQQVVEAYFSLVQTETGKPFPQSPQRAALERHRRRLRQLDEYPRHHLPPAA